MVAGWMDAPVVVDPITLVAAHIVLRILACCIIIVSCALRISSVNSAHVLKLKITFS